MSKDYSHGLDKILKKKRNFLIDTGVLFSRASGVGCMEDDITRLAAELTHQNRRFESLEHVFNVIRQHDNVRVTPEIYQEMVSKLGHLATVQYKGKTKLKIAERAKDYFRDNRDNLVMGQGFWPNGPFFEAGHFIEDEFKRLYPDLKPLSMGDVSLLLSSLELVFGEEYKRTDIIACDYGILKGAEIMFGSLDRIPIPKHLVPTKVEKARRTAGYRCVKVIHREFGENYHDAFNSLEHCEKLRK